MSQPVNASAEFEQSGEQHSPHQIPREGSQGAGETGVRPLNGGSKRAGSPTFACNDHWAELVRLIWSEYAFSTMYGVNVVAGNIVSYNNVQRNFTFGPGGGEKAETPVFDEYWRALQALCLQIGTGRLAEVKFISGRPIAARTDEGGRRMKRLNKRSDDQRSAWPGEPS